jgi:hypothetical protein
VWVPCVTECLYAVEVGVCGGSFEVSPGLCYLRSLVCLDYELGHSMPYAVHARV